MARSNFQNTITTHKDASTDITEDITDYAINNICVQLKHIEHTANKNNEKILYKNFWLSNERL